MTTAPHHRDSRRRARGTREVVELALLCLVAGAAHLGLAGLFDTGSSLLITSGAVLLAAAAARHMWVHRPEAEPDPAAHLEIAEPEQRRDLWRLRTAVPDRPGRLAELASGLAGIGGDIRTVHVHPVADGAVDELLVHVPGSVGREEVVHAVTAAGGREVTACRADVRELDDVPTRTLSLATELVQGRADLVWVLRGVLGDVQVRWQEDPPAEAAVDEFAERVLCLSAPGGGTLVVDRAGHAFTPAEFARARAMVQLAAGCRARMRPQVHEFRTRDGHELTVRVGEREDVALVQEFHARCSAATRYRRYFGPGPAAGQGGLLRLLTPSLGRSLLVQTAGGEVVAMGNLMREGESGEIALLVRDDWQRRGVGRELASRLVAEAESAGLSSLVANTHVDNTAIARTLRGAGLKLVGVPEPGEWSWRRALAAEPSPVD